MPKDKGLTKDMLYLEYPYNLLQAVRGKTRIVLPDALTTDIEAGIYYAVVTLPEESQTFIKLRYCQNKTVEETAGAMHLSLEQLKAVEDKTLHPLRQPYRLGFIQHGVDGNMRRKMGSAYHKGYYCGFRAGCEAGSGALTPRTDLESMDTSLECQDLSPRVLNALLAGNCETVGDVVRLGYDGVFVLRNLGAKGLREVAVMLKTQGFHSPEWDRWLPSEPDNSAVIELSR